MCLWITWKMSGFFCCIKDKYEYVKYVTPTEYTQKLQQIRKISILDQKQFLVEDWCLNLRLLKEFWLFVCDFGTLNVLQLLGVLYTVKVDSIPDFSLHVMKQ